jgi:hypothetical protein
MKVWEIDGVKYKLPNELNPFQLKLYVHLINWKWKNITKEAGVFEYEGRIYQNDAILPESCREEYPLIYKTVLDDFLEHQNHYKFKLHDYFNHMASSQVANVNLFLPVLLSSNCDSILKQFKPDFNSLATEQLYKGFRIEFWSGNSDDDTGLLSDHTPDYGTDSDIAIAYYNNENKLCLWLIEHKLAEVEFSTCGGYTTLSKRKNRLKHKCDKPFSEIIENKNLCYYKDIRKFKYWEVTDNNKAFFKNHNEFEECPFQGGTNQLWRNQILGMAVEKEDNNPFEKVYFSVVSHPENIYLNESINSYKKLIGDNPKFSVFTSADVLKATESANNPSLNNWIKWYKELYKI